MPFLFTFEMAKTVNVNFRMDEDLKKIMEQTCSEMGLSMTTAFTIFAKKVAREKRIPFEVSAERNTEYLAKLDTSLEQLRQGNVVVKTMEELEAMENE